MSRNRSYNPTVRIAGGALTASALLIFASACRDSGIKSGETPAAPAEQPVVVQPVTEVAQPEAGSVIPTNVSYADAESTFRAKDYAQATEMFDVYTKGHDKNAWGHYMLGLSAWRSGQLERARAAFDDALTLDPRHVKSLVNLSRVLLESDKPAEAKPYLATAIEVDPGSSDAYRVLGRTEMLLGNADAALESYRSALAIDPDDVWSMNNMGLALIQQGRFDDALAPLARATQLTEGVAVFQNNLGIALERTGHYGAAAAAYKATLAADSGYSKAEASLARVEGREDEPGVEPVTVSELGDSFANTVSDWHWQRVSEVETPLPDSGAAKSVIPLPDSGAAKSVTTVSKADSLLY